MLAELKFVQGSVAKKDFVPALTHFKIAGGRIQGYNGNISLSSPIGLDLNVTPNGLKFIKAIETCKEAVAISLTPTGRLSIKSGPFKAYVECTNEFFPEVFPEGEIIPLEKGFLPAIKKMQPFIAIDASRPWATGLYFSGQSAFATNNIVIAQQWLDYKFPVQVNIPAVTIRELLRIKEEPTSIQVCENSITFHYSNDKWMRSQLSPLGWPDITPVLNREHSAVPIVPGFFDALESILPFVDELFSAYLSPGLISTSPNDGEGARVEVPGLVADGRFNVNQLLLLRDQIKTIDLTMYPAPCLFFNETFRGAIVGIRK